MASIEVAPQPKLEKWNWEVGLLTFMRVNGNVSDMDGSKNKDNDIPQMSMGNCQCLIWEHIEMLFHSIEKQQMPLFDSTDVA